MSFQSNGWFKGKLVRNLEIPKIEAMNVTNPPTNANTNQEDLTLQDWQSDDNGQNSYLINSTRIIKVSFFVIGNFGLFTQFYRNYKMHVSMSRNEFV